MTSKRTLRVADDAAIYLSVSARDDGRFYWLAKTEASQRAGRVPFWRAAALEITSGRADGDAPSATEAAHCAEAAALRLRDALLLEYARLAAQVEIDRANVAAAESAFPEEIRR